MVYKRQVRKMKDTVSGAILVGLLVSYRLAPDRSKSLRH